MAPAQGENYARLALAEEQRVRANYALEFDGGAETRAGSRDTTFGERYCQSSFADVVRRAHQAFRDRLQADALDLLLDVQVDPRRRATHQVMRQCQILAASELFACPPQQNDHVTFGLEPLRRVMIDVLQKPDHRNGRGRGNRGALGLVVETDVAADDRHVQGVARVANAAHRFAELPHDLRLLWIAEIQAIGDTQRRCAGTHHIARAFDHRDHRPDVRIERTVAA